MPSPVIGDTCGKAPINSYPCYLQWLLLFVEHLLLCCWNLPNSFEQNLNLEMKPCSLMKSLTQFTFYQRILWRSFQRSQQNLTFGWTIQNEKGKKGADAIETANILFCSIKLRAWVRSSRYKHEMNFSTDKMASIVRHWENQNNTTGIDK